MQALLNDEAPRTESVSEFDIDAETLENMGEDEIASMIRRIESSMGNMHAQVDELNALHEKQQERMRKLAAGGTSGANGTGSGSGSLSLGGRGANELQQLELDIRDLKIKIGHLERTQVELEQLVQDDPSDEVLREAFVENKPILVRMKKNLAHTEAELQKKRDALCLGTSAARASLTQGLSQQQESHAASEQKQQQEVKSEDERKQTESSDPTRRSQQQGVTGSQQGSTPTSDSPSASQNGSQSSPRESNDMEAEEGILL